MSRKLITVLVLGSLVTPVLYGQLVSGALVGFALDPQGAAVGAVQVMLRNSETGVVKTTATAEDGSYRISALEPGVYSAEFRREGFQILKVDPINITTAKDTTVNAPLQLGALAQEVSVSVAGIELDKTSPTIRLNLRGQTLDETPLSTSSLVPAGSRNQARYALLAPAVARVPGQNETSANGHRGRDNNFLADGIENNDNTTTLAGIFIPPEAIRELQVQVAPFSAEFGHSMGAQINVTTRSGSNAVHGELWDFSRSSALEPLSLSSQIAGFTKTPHLSAHQFGGAVGGPIKQDKTFFFGIVQGNIQRTIGTLSGVTIPTPTGYAALLNAPLRPAGTLPAQSSASRQVMLDAISFLPEFYAKGQTFTNLASVSVNGSPIEVGTFRPVIPQNQKIWYFGGRVDHHIGNDTLAYRTHIEHRNKPLGAGSSNRTFGERFAADDLTVGQNHALSFTKIVSTKWVNETRLAYARLDPSFIERDPETSTTKISSPSFMIGGAEGFPQQRLEQTYQIQNLSTYAQGKHALKVGFDLARTRMDNNNAPNSKGTWTFNNLQDYMNNQPANLVQLVVANSRYSFNDMRQAYFLQDDIKFTPTFTANLGLRYESYSVPFGYFGATSQTEIDALVPAPTKRDRNNWGPRVGFAYSPKFTSGLLASIFGSGHSSIRGGFGVAYDVLFYNILVNPATNFPRNSPNSTSTTALVDSFPTLASTSITAPSMNATTGFVNVPTDTQRPTTNYWTLSIQRQLTEDVTVEVGYTGNRSYHLLRQGQGNPAVLDPAKAAFVVSTCTFATIATCPDPAGFQRSPTAATTTDSGRLDPRFGSRVLLEATGQAEYHAAYVRIEKKFSNGLQFGGNYTWSANLSDSEDLLIGDSLLLGSSPANPQDYRNRRNEWARSALDRPHRVAAHYSYRIPGFTDSTRVLRELLSGWQVSGLTELQSGQPFTIRIGVDAIGNGLSAANSASRPNYNPGGILVEDPNTGNLRTFTIPVDGTGIVTAPFVTSSTGAVSFIRNSMPGGGTLGRNTFRGPGYANTNLSLMKRFVLPNEMQLQIRGDLINAFNHDNFANPDSNMSNAATGTFGKQTLTPLTDARQVLLGAKLSF